MVVHCSCTNAAIPIVIMYETAAREPRNFDGCDTCHVNIKDTDYY